MQAPARAIAKIGARHSKADKERIKKIHDLVVRARSRSVAPAATFRAPTSSRTRNFRPRPARPATSAFDDNESEKVAKILGRLFEQQIEQQVERPFAKALRGVTARIDEMAARMKKIEQQPLPLGTSSVRVAEKSEDSQFAAPDQLLDRPGTLEALAELAIRKAQSNPMRAMPGFKPRQG